MGRAASVVIGITFAVLSIGLSSCCKGKNKAGDQCSSNGKVACGDGTALVCEGGTWKSYRCGGPAGCSEKGGTATCDWSGNAVGEACPVIPNADRSCSDRANFIQCLDGKVKKWPCKGAKGCRVEGGKPLCDESLADEGDDCMGTGSACTLDQKKRLICKNFRYTVDRECRGPEKCSIDTVASKVKCDVSVAFVGDSCSGSEGAWACSPDARNTLVCKSGIWTYGQRCSGGRGCWYEKPKDMIHCD